MRNFPFFISHNNTATFAKLSQKSLAMQHYSGFTTLFTPEPGPQVLPSGNQDRQGAGGKRKETKKRRPPQGAQKRYAPTHDLTVSGRRSGDARARRAHTQTAQAPLAPTATFARLSAFRPHPATFVKAFAKVFPTLTEHTYVDVLVVGGRSVVRR